MARRGAGEAAWKPDPAPTRLPPLPSRPDPLKTARSRLGGGLPARDAGAMGTASPPARSRWKHPGAVGAPARQGPEARVIHQRKGGNGGRKVYSL